jgi:hypothetical protein
MVKNTFFLQGKFKKVMKPSVCCNIFIFHNVFSLRFNYMCHKVHSCKWWRVWKLELYYNASCLTSLFVLSLRYTLLMPCFVLSVCLAFNNGEGNQYWKLLWLSHFVLHIEHFGMELFNVVQPSFIGKYISSRLWKCKIVVESVQKLQVISNFIKTLLQCKCNNLIFSMFCAKTYYIKKREVTIAEFACNLSCTTMYTHTKQMFT